jgi:monofunctional biosynthetic peptidoglycan transglycosylase
MWSRFKKAALFMVIGSLATTITMGTYIYLGLPDVSVLQIQNPKTTALMHQRYRQAQEKGKNFVVRQQWVALERIPKLLKDSVRISEDAGFYRHQGVDFTELKAAIKKNWQKGKYARGASTITQQLAKNLYLSTDKNITRKLKELVIAIRLEKHLKKNRIFHLYLNVIEFGPGIFGVAAAARHYFHKEVGSLNLEECVRLAAVIPKPLKENPVKNSRWLEWKARWILDTLRKNRYISQAHYRSAIKSFR